MKSKQPNKHSKERFISPRVIHTARYELENELLGASDQPQEITSIIQATGHERVEVTTIDYSYWEEN